MAHHQSAIKRIRQTKKRRLYNRQNKKLVKTAIKEVEQATTPEEAQEKFRHAASVLDKVASRGILHKNAVANKKSKLSRYVKSLKEKA